MNSHLKRALGLHKKSSTAAMHMELGTIPLIARRQIKQLKLWKKILHLPQDNYIRLIYNKELGNIQKSRWSKHVKETLKDYGLFKYWIH